MASPNTPFYKQLGYASTIQGIRTILEQRIGLCGSAIRIERVVYTGKEGKSKEGCPIAKFVLRRSGEHEVLLALVRHRSGHKCDAAYIIVAIVVWDAIDLYFADQLYDIVVYKVNKFGIATERKCAQNEAKFCVCQGIDANTSGACYSFGCSWSMFRDGCKFRDSKPKKVRKFKLRNENEECELEYYLQQLATGIAPLYEAIAPEAYYNQITFESEASDCRLGTESGRPFTGVTACLDFCAHSHKDRHNINNGCTVVVSLTKYRCFGAKLVDEQLHVLPMYSMDTVDEYGSVSAQQNKQMNGSLHILSKYPTIKRINLKQYQKHIQKSKISTKRNAESREKLLILPNNRIKYKFNLQKDMIIEYDSDNDNCFETSSYGGVGIALSHRSVLFECAKHEIHATTGLKQPNRQNPSRISLVFYQHRSMNYSSHGKHHRRLSKL